MLRYIGTQSGQAKGAVSQVPVKVRSLKRANNLYCLIDKRERLRERRREEKQGGEEKGNVVLRGDRG